MERTKHRANFIERALTVAAAWFIRALGATLRVRLDGAEVISETLASGTPVIVFGWHELLLIACCDLKHFRPHIMISQSRDGERIANVVERIGWRVVRGSSSRGGARALLELVRALREPTLVGHLIDGPRGPRREVKPGVITMAQRSRAMVVPMSYFIERKWTAPSWDGFQLPMPFSRVVGRVLPARCIALNLDDRAVEELCVELGDELMRAYVQLEAELSGQPAPANCRT